MSYMTWQRIKANCLRLLTSTSTGFLLYFALSNVVNAQTQNKVMDGWNLLGNGVNSQIAVSSAFGNAANVTSVWKWDASSSNWAFYTPSLSDGGAAYAFSKGYAALTAINPGEGYWVNAKAEFSLPGATAAVYSASNYLPASPTALLPGWSLIGIGDGISASAFNSSLSKTTLTPGSIPVNVTSLWAWDSANSAWYFYAPKLDADGNLSSYITSKGYKDFNSNSVLLKDGVGFWVNNPATGLNAVSGTIIGLASGTSVTLSNAGLSQTVSYNGRFSFTLSTGSNYSIAVSNQPAGQVCTVTNGVGVAVTQNISGVSVVCVASAYTVGGTVTGLANGAQVTLYNNGTNARTVSVNGSFTFSTLVLGNGSYAVTVREQPTGQTCIVSSGSGSGVVANVSNVTVTCSTITVQDPRPVAVIKAIDPVMVGKTVTLDGTGSTDPKSAKLTYSWSLKKPLVTIRDTGLSDPTNPKPTFAIDASGSYEVSLTVSNGALTSAASTLVVNGVNSAFGSTNLLIYGKGKTDNQATIFIGCLTCDADQPDSVCKPDGDYGWVNSASSIWNVNSDYGGMSAFSPWNAGTELIKTPLVFNSLNEIVGIFTANGDTRHSPQTDDLFGKVIQPDPEAPDTKFLDNLFAAPSPADARLALCSPAPMPSATISAVKQFSIATVKK